MPKITAANKGEKVVFTPEEQTTLKNAAAAAKKFENTSGLFTPKNLAALATQINNAKGILSTANKYAKSNTEEMAKQTPPILPAVKSDENNNESTPLLPVEQYVYTITDTVPQPIMANGAVVGYSATRTITRTRVDYNSRVPAITYTNIRAELITVDNANNPQAPALLPNGTGSLPTTAKYAANFAPEFLKKLVADNTSVNIPLRWNALACTSGLPTPAVDLAYEAMAEAQMQGVLPVQELPLVQAFIAAFNNSTPAEQALWQTAFNTANARLTAIQNGMARIPQQLTGLIKFVYFEGVENGNWIRAEHVANQLRTMTTENVIRRQAAPIYERYWENSKGGRTRTATNVTPNDREKDLLNLLVARCGNTSYYSLNGGDGSIYSIDEDNAKNPPLRSTATGAWYVALPENTTPATGITVEIPDWCDFNFDAIQRAATQLCNNNQYSMATAEGFTQRADRAIVRQMEALDNLIKLSAENNNPAEMQATISAWQQRVAQNRTLLDTMRVFQPDPNCFTPPVPPITLPPINANIRFVPDEALYLNNNRNDILNAGNTIAIAITNAINALINQVTNNIINVPVPNEPPVQIQRQQTITNIIVTSISIDFNISSLSPNVDLMNARVALMMPDLSSNSNLQAISNNTRLGNVNLNLGLATIASPTGNETILLPRLNTRRIFNTVETLLNPLQ